MKCLSVPTPPWAVHVIDTRAALPIKVRARPIPMAKREACARQLEDMLADGIIVPSTSPWSAPVVMAQKKDGTLRFCVDYRSLNEVTVKDCYPMPHIEDCLEALGGNTWYCSVDLASGFWQVALDPASQPMTAFATDRGLCHTDSATPLPRLSALWTLSYVT